jgi:hypothetical protein
MTSNSAVQYFTDVRSCHQSVKAVPLWIHADARSREFDHVIIFWVLTACKVCQLMLAFRGNTCPSSGLAAHFMFRRFFSASLQTYTLSKPRGLENIVSNYCPKKWTDAVALTGHVILSVLNSTPSIIPTYWQYEIPGWWRHWLHEPDILSAFEPSKNVEIFVSVILIYCVM